MRIQVVGAVAASAALSAWLSAQTPSPVPDLATRDQHLAEIAIEAARRPSVDPIPLQSGDRVAGVVYDQFFLGVLVARAAGAAGAAVDAAAVTGSPQWRSHRMVVVAYPTDCDGKPDRPLAVRFVPGLTVPVKLPDPPPPVRGADPATADLLPGVTLPGDALVAPVPTLPLVNAKVEVDYDSPFCHGASTTGSFALTTIPGALARGVNGVKLPEGATDPSPTTVRISALLDLDGRPRFMALSQGSAALAPTAMTAMAAGRPTPTTINGVPAPLFVVTAVVFTSTGSPGQAAPLVPPPGSTGMRITTTVAAPVQPTSTPPMPLDRREALVARLAIDSASAAPTTVSLDVDGSKRHGAFLDRFLMQVAAARDAAAAGHPYDPLSPPPEFVTKSSLVVALPLDCGHRVLPTSIQMVADTGPVLKVSSVLSGPDLAAAAGTSWPDGAIGQLFATSGSTGTSQSVVIAYVEPACDASSVALKLQRDPPHAISPDPRIPAPSGVTLASLTTVHVQGIMDATGVPRYLVAVDGPPELATSAAVAGAAWKFQPSRLNGTATPIPLTLAIAFLPSVNVSAPSVGPAPMTSSAVNGRLTHDTFTPDVPGLDVTTSRCGVATDAGYGTSPASPIKSGGDMVTGPGREQKYMTALRGPAGQGLHFARLGSLMGPDKTILDMYEVSYAGLPQAVRLYLDEYRSDILQAPRGFTCAVPLDIK